MRNSRRKAGENAKGEGAREGTIGERHTSSVEEMAAVSPGSAGLKARAVAPDFGHAGISGDTEIVFCVM